MNKCDLCNKTFKTDYLLNKHKNSKIKCTENNKKENITTNDFLDIKQIKKKINNIQYQMQKKRTESISCIDNKCNYCNVIFTRKQNLIRHLDNNNCSIKKNMLQQIETLNSEANKYIIMKNKIIADLQKENKIINKANNNITNNTDNSSNTNITNNTNNTTNITNNNLTLQIQINPFGKEDTSFLTHSVMRNILKNPDNGIPMELL